MGSICIRENDDESASTSQRRDSRPNKIASHFSKHWEDEEDSDIDKINDIR